LASRDDARLEFDGRDRGHTEFQDDMGVPFIAVPFKRPRAIAASEHVRFEIKP
jgi:hypothetical protein